MNLRNLLNLMPHGAAALLPDLALKGFVIVLCATAVSFLMRRASAASKFWLWFLTLAVLLLVPALSASGLRSQRPIWAVSANPTAGNEVEFRVELAPRAIEPSAERTITATAPSSANVLATSPRHFGIRVSKPWLPVLAAVWGAVALTLLCRQLLPLVQLSAMRRRCQPVSTGTAQLAKELADELGLRRNVTVLEAPDATMPVTWGFFRPVILLPVAARTWAAERLQVVLLHELAHVKRRDCLAQGIAELACAIHWFNPLAWHGARIMRDTREHACDDLVLNRGCKPSDYAAHLVSIARSLSGDGERGAVAMARPSRLGERVAAITDATRTRHSPRQFIVGAWFIAAVGIAAAIAAQKPDLPGTPERERLRSELINQLRTFSDQKYEHAIAQAAANNEKMLPELAEFFQAAKAGDYRTVTNKYNALKRRHPQYEKTPETDDALWVSYWQHTLEICLAYFDVSSAEPKYLRMALDGFMEPVPAGAVYFGGTDPGRGLPTAFSKSHAGADPFFTITQNALANGNYMDYLRALYGDRLVIPSSNDVHTAYEAYKADAAHRMATGQLRPGENVTKSDTGEISVSGQVAVMAVNAGVAKQIFEKNSEKHFYIEESFPLDWMYPHLEPAGQIMKLNREPLENLPDATIQRDTAYWTGHVDQMIGPWLRADTSISALVQFVEKVYVEKDLSGFKGDPLFVQNWWAQRAFSKWRSSIGGVYAWRAMRRSPGAEQRRMTKASDFAFRQAFAICPSSPEALYRYINVLAGERRYSDAILIAQAAQKVDPKKQTERLIEELQRLSTNDLNDMRRQRDQAKAEAENAIRRLHEAGAGSFANLDEFDAARGQRDSQIATASTHAEKLLAYERYGASVKQLRKDIDNKIFAGQKPQLVGTIAHFRMLDAELDLGEARQQR